MRNGGLHHQEGAEWVGRELALERGRIDLAEQSKFENAGVIDQDVDLPTAPNDCVDQDLDLARLRDISADGKRRATVSLDGVNDRRSVRLVAFVVHGDPCAVRARRFAIADPMPLDAPVTIAAGLESMIDFPCRQRSLKPGDESSAYCLRFGRTCHQDIRGRTLLHVLEPSAAAAFR
jgi:hypothetical protein